MRRSDGSQWVVRVLLTVLAGVLVAWLAGCGGGSAPGGPGGGGGGGGTQAPSAAQVTVAAGTKQLQFTWTGGAGAMEFRLMQNPDGQSGFTQAGASLAGSATGATLDIAAYRVNWAAAQYAVDACNAGGCTRSNAVSVMSSMLQSIGYFKASNTGAGDAFGSSVALSSDGNTLAVGAVLEDSAATGVNGNQGDNSAALAGAVYVFARLGGMWIQQAYVKASNTQANDRFGGAVALSANGDTLAVGAPGEASASAGINGNQGNNSAALAGAVYVFTRSAGVWSQEAYVKASLPQADDQFGTTVALSTDGNRLAAGAFSEDSGATGINGNEADQSAPASGAAYVFTRSAGVWSQEAFLKASNTGAGDRFGISIGLSGDGNTLAVGANQEDSASAGVNGNQNDDSAAQAGAVYVFTRSASVWSQEAYVKASNAEGLDNFGEALALSGDGNTLAVGAPFEASTATGIGGNQGDNSANDAGAVYVFTRSAGTWSQQAYVKASNTGGGDRFGFSVALNADGNALAVGAEQEDSASIGINGNQSDDSLTNPGAAYVFTRAGGVWSQQSYVKAPNSGNFDTFHKLALSADGNTLAVAARNESGAATGINGNQADETAGGAGAVYLY